MSDKKENKSFLDRINLFPTDIEELDFQEYKKKMETEIDVFWKDMSEDETKEIVQNMIKQGKTLKKSD